MRNLFSGFFRRKSLLVAFAWVFACSIYSPAQQDSSTPASQEEVNKQLQQRVDELEKQVKQLEEKQAAGPPAVSVPAPESEMPTVNEVAPRLKLIVFGDVGASVLSHVPSTFEFGSLDLFMTARLSNKVSALGEALFIAQSDNSVAVDVERLLLGYRQSDYFDVSIGRYHTWVGYYNTAFNKGEFLETAVDRPFFYQFDDNGGFLPMQDLGVNVTGKIPSGSMGLNYVLEVGNGRAWGLNVEPAQNYQDAKRVKPSTADYSSVPRNSQACKSAFPSATTISRFPDLRWERRSERCMAFLPTASTKF
jgi:hypothetical protein